MIACCNSNRHTKLTLQDVVYQRGLSSTQEASDNCDWHLALIFVCHAGVLEEEQLKVDQTTRTAEGGSEQLLSETSLGKTFKLRNHLLY